MATKETANLIYKYGQVQWGTRRVMSPVKKHYTGALAGSKYSCRSVASSTTVFGKFLLECLKVPDFYYPIIGIFSCLATWHKHCRLSPALETEFSFNWHFFPWLMHACMLHFCTWQKPSHSIAVHSPLVRLIFNFCPVILGCPAFDKPGSLPLSSQVLNSTAKCHSARIFLDLDHNSYYLYYSWYNSRACGASASFVLDLWSNLFTNTNFWFSLDMNEIINVSTIL